MSFLCLHSLVAKPEAICSYCSTSKVSVAPASVKLLVVGLIYTLLAVATTRRVDGVYGGSFVYYICRLCSPIITCDDITKLNKFCFQRVQITDPHYHNPLLHDKPLNSVPFQCDFRNGQVSQCIPQAFLARLFFIHSISHIFLTSVHLSPAVGAIMKISACGFSDI